MHYSSVYQTIRKIIPEANTCEDLAQEVFVRFWEKRHQIEIQGEIGPYLHRMAVNEALGYLRKQKKYKSEEIDEQFDLNTQDPDASDIYAYKELQEAVDAAIEQLPPKCRAVFVLSRFDGYSYKEIGEEMNISTKTVENQMGKALKTMKLFLKKYLPILLFFFWR